LPSIISSVDTTSNSFSSSTFSALARFRDDERVEGRPESRGDPSLEDFELVTSILVRSRKLAAECRDGTGEAFPTLVTETGELSGVLRETNFWGYFSLGMCEEKSNLT
jgi:hypothetical protein